MVGMLSSGDTQRQWMAELRPILIRELDRRSDFGRRNVDADPAIGKTTLRISVRATKSGRDVITAGYDTNKQQYVLFNGGDDLRYGTAQELREDFLRVVENVVPDLWPSGKVPPSVMIAKFASICGSLRRELRNRDTSLEWPE